MLRVEENIGNFLFIIFGCKNSVVFNYSPLMDEWKLIKISYELFYSCFSMYCIFMGGCVTNIFASSIRVQGSNRVY